MVNKLPCLYGFISETSTGNRNENLFRALAHLRHYNQTAMFEDLITEAMEINKQFQSPLSDHEVRTVLQHTLNKNYRTRCWKFKKYCKHCRYGKFRKLFRNSKPDYWKHINEHNRLIGIKLIEDDKYYPWDILDTSKMTPEDAAEIQKFREMMGIPIAIDTIVKSYGIPIGDKAKRQWDKFRKSD
ncbi:MAG: primase C-terminal domain-containing protein [Methanosphaera sp.]|nr:primase C-terminal domain-containing protein [Methanosphaera sp.]